MKNINEVKIKMIILKQVKLKLKPNLNLFYFNFLGKTRTNRTKF